MTATAETIQEFETIEAPLIYYVDDGIPPTSETGDELNPMRVYKGTYKPHIMAIKNARPIKDSFELERNGFEFIDHPTKVKNFLDPDEMKSVYYKETEEVIKAYSGASRVHVFDHTLRSGDEQFRADKPIREPVKRVHNDYTEVSGPQRVRDLLPDEADELLKHRFAIIQLWRAINKPIQSDPLCICDARTLKSDQLFVSKRISPGRVGETYVISHSSEHDWLYFPEMTRDEALVFKVFDSITDGPARFTAHCSFDLPNTPPNAPPRESCEMRALAFFGPE
jgi:hypothetical protein